MAANARNAVVFRANMHQMVAMMRDPAFHASLKLEFISEMPSGMGMWYHFHHSMSFTSWGEKILITLMPVNQDSVSVEISSECAAPTQFIDWGKNRQNIDEIFTFIANNLPRYGYIPSAPAAASGFKFCTKCGNRLDAAAVFCTVCGTKQG